MFPYVDVDYERNPKGDGVTDVATSTTMGLKLHAIRVLADRAAILSPALLLPYEQEKNPEGVKYENITVPSLKVTSQERYFSLQLIRIDPVVWVVIPHHLGIMTVAHFVEILRQRFDPAGTEDHQGFMGAYDGLRRDFERWTAVH